MINETICEIPVYSCDQKEFVVRRTAYAEKIMADVPDYGNGYWQEQRDEVIQRGLKPIRYNELVGCIEVHFVGTQLRADYWFTDKARVVIGSRDKGIINWCGKLLEKHYCSSSLSSKEIFLDFRTALATEIGRHFRLRRRFVDFSTFDRCGHFIDWRALLKI